MGRLGGVPATSATPGTSGLFRGVVDHPSRSRSTRLRPTDTPVDFRSYVEEDQEAQGAPASLKGEPRQAPEHGSRLTPPHGLRLDVLPP